MKKAEEGKTKEYTLRAINKYNAKFDRIAVNLPIGSKEWIKTNTGKSCNRFFCDLFEEYKRNHDSGSASVFPDLEDGAPPFE